MLFGRPSMLKFFPAFLKPAPFFKLFASLGSTNMFAISLFFFFPTIALSLPHRLLLRLSFYLNHSGRKCLLFPSVLSGYNGSPYTRFSRGTTRLMNWPDEQRNSCPLQSLVVSFLFLLVFFLGLKAYCSI